MNLDNNNIGDDEARRLGAALKMNQVMYLRVGVLHLHVKRFSQRRT